MAGTQIPLVVLMERCTNYVVQQRGCKSCIWKTSGCKRRDTLDIIPTRMRSEMSKVFAKVHYEKICDDGKRTTRSNSTVVTGRDPDGVAENTTDSGKARA